MFNLDQLVDSIQSSKKQFVATVVKQDEIRNSINEIIDAQTQYTKIALDTMTKIGKTVSEETVKSIKETATYDWSKLAELTKIKSK